MHSKEELCVWVSCNGSVKTDSRVPQHPHWFSELRTQNSELRIFLFNPLNDYNEYIFFGIITMSVWVGRQMLRHAMSLSHMPPCGDFNIL